MRSLYFKFYWRVNEENYIIGHRFRKAKKNSLPRYQPRRETTRKVLERNPYRYVGTHVQLFTE